ncbi:MAG: hypothetical protein ACRCWQ_09475 [Bacilli bacterium]
MKILDNKYVSFAIRFLIAVARTPIVLYRLCTNPFYRDYFKDKYIRPYLNWKTYLLIAVLVVVGITGKIIHYRWYGIKVCWGEQWDTGRETKYGVLFNTCVIDTGRTDADGNKIWTKVNRDMNPGD